MAMSFPFDNDWRCITVYLMSLFLFWSAQSSATDRPSLRESRKQRSARCSLLDACLSGIFQGRGLIDLPLRASNEGSPEAARCASTEDQSGSTPPLFREHGPAWMSFPIHLSASKNDSLPLPLPIFASSAK